MSATPLRILQVSLSDVGGGAERSARNLVEELRRLGQEAWLAVGYRKTGEQSDAFLLASDQYRNVAVRVLDRVRADPQGLVHRVRGMGRLTALLRRLAEPGRSLAVERGREDFAFPGTSRLLDLPPRRPDIVHLHNLHGDYFDLRVLPTLSREVPTILNVRDGWLMSGHCAFSLDCDRWKSGCGTCPDLTLYPSVKKDATAFNWVRKRDILANSRLYVATASQWMMDRVDESIIAAAAIERRVIPNGVDTSRFDPGDRQASRAELSLPAGAHVLLVAANGLRFNVWKDFETLRAAVAILGSRDWRQPLIVLAVGETAASQTIGRAELRFVPFQSQSTLAHYYRAADVYLHAAKVESFGNVLLEARACGTPVVATAVGGIPEQIHGLEGPWSPEGIRTHPRTEATGVLVPQADPRRFADAADLLLRDPVLARQLGENGLHHVRNEFTVGRQAARFLEWYRQIVVREQGRVPA